VQYARSLLERYCLLNSNCACQVYQITQTFYIQFDVVAEVECVRKHSRVADLSPAGRGLKFTDFDYMASNDIKIWCMKGEWSW
jgi:hypothetical protein